MPAGFFVLWTFVGILIGVPYLILSGGDLNHTPLLAFVAPAFVCALIVSFTIERKRKGGWFFWSLIAWMISPIILNGTHYVLLGCDWVKPGLFVFQHRFTPLWGAPLTLIIIGVAWRMLEEICKKDSNGAIPPSASPPNGGGTSTGLRAPDVIEEAADRENRLRTLRVAT